VAAIEHAQFHALEGLDILYQLRADLLERRATIGEMVLDHPLGEGLGHDRPGILGANQAGDRLAISVCGRGHDAIDHGAGESHLAHPLAQRRIAQAGKLGNDALHRGAIAGQVIAAHHRKRRNARCLAARQRFHQHARRRFRRGWVGEVMHHVGVALVELASCRIVAIALFGYGQ
jgi:hypothetical protein